MFNPRLHTKLHTNCTKSLWHNGFDSLHNGFDSPHLHQSRTCYFSTGTGFFFVPQRFAVFLFSTAFLLSELNFAHEAKNCTRNCTRKTGSFVRHQAPNIVLYFPIVFDFFFFDRVLVGGFQHIVCSVSHALHGVFVRDADGQHSGSVNMA